MATISNVRFQRFGRLAFPVAGVPLESLPFAAAVLGPSGETIGVNSAWRDLHGEAPTGASGLEWCPATLRSELLSAIGKVRLDSPESIEYSEDGASRRIQIGICAEGAILCDQPVTPAKPDRRREESEKMETVGRLVGGVAHDFANLLTLIAGYSDILLSRLNEQDPLRTELDEIRVAANRGARLTAQLLGFTRGQSVERRPIDLNSVVANLDRMLRLIVGECVELDLDLAMKLDKVVADPGQMEQVIMNLILNARDAMPAGGTIRITTSNLESCGAKSAGRAPALNGPGVLLSIKDTGHGIDRAALEHIFEPFFTTKEIGKGTGLGLSTVHRIVQETGGAIWVESEPGRGATFCVALPVASRAAEPGEAVVTADRSGTGSETLLLVEDDDNVRRLLTHVLGKRGYTVLEASTGEEALRIFESRCGQVDLVITDMVMPQMGGRELGERLERSRPGTKVIYMSGYTDDVLVRTGALGPDMPFLQKPLRPEVLAAKVREALDGK